LLGPPLRLVGLPDPRPAQLATKILGGPGSRASAADLSGRRSRVSNDEVSFGSPIQSCQVSILLMVRATPNYSCRIQERWSARDVVFKPQDTRDVVFEPRTTVAGITQHQCAALRVFSANAGF